MCDMQKMPTREDASCEEDTDMNFATFSAVGTAGTHFVTTGGQLPVAKLQQNVTNNGTGMPQVCVAMGDGGVQYMRALDGSVQAAPQLITVPIQLAGAKPGDPQPTVQIQVLSPSMLQAQQQPKYQMQIPIQGFQQGGAVLTVAYSPEANETGGIQLVGQGSLSEGLQVLAALPQEMQLVQQTQEKDHMHQNMHQVFITPNQQIIINAPDNKTLNNNTTSDNNNTESMDIIIKEECEDNTNDDESSQGLEAGDGMQWQLNQCHQQDLVKYLSTLPPQQTQALPVSLQQFLRLNPTDVKKPEQVEIEIEMDDATDDKKEEPVAEAVLSEGKRISSNLEPQINQQLHEVPLLCTANIATNLVNDSVEPQYFYSLVYPESSNEASTRTNMNNNPLHVYNTNELQYSPVSSKHLTGDNAPRICSPNPRNLIVQAVADDSSIDSLDSLYNLVNNLGINIIDSKDVNIPPAYQAYETRTSIEVPAVTSTRTNSPYDIVRPPEEYPLITNQEYERSFGNVIVTNPYYETLKTVQDYYLTNKNEYEEIVPANNDVPCSYLSYRNSQTTDEHLPETWPAFNIGEESLDQAGLRDALDVEVPLDYTLLGRLGDNETMDPIIEDGTLRIQSKKKKKYKKKPPKPARPKPGQVVIATALDGSPIFCCPECQMAYPEKEQLEIHLIVHKIERRFICGICGAGLKRKEHLERHKLGHNPERPYVCGVCRKGFKRREHLNLHTVIHSGVKTEMCTECGKGFYRKDHLRKHTRSHESKRARDEAAGDSSPAPAQPVSGNNNIMPEITIHIPTSSNSQMPVQINIPPHVVSSLAASQQAGEHATLDALLAHHS